MLIIFCCLLSPFTCTLYPLENEPIKQWCHYFRHRSLKQIMLSTLHSDYKLNRTDDTLLLPQALLVWAEWFIRRKKCTCILLWCMPGRANIIIYYVVFLKSVRSSSELHLQIEDIHVNFQNDGGWQNQYCRLLLKFQNFDSALKPTVVGIINTGVLCHQKGQY